MPDSLWADTVVGRTHAIGERLTGFLRGYGSKWPRQRLLMLSLLVFDVYLAIDESAAHQTPSAMRQLEMWRREMLGALLEDALAEA